MVNFFHGDPSVVCQVKPLLDFSLLAEVLAVTRVLDFFKSCLRLLIINILKLLQMRGHLPLIILELNR